MDAQHILLMDPMHTPKHTYHTQIKDKKHKIMDTHTNIQPIAPRTGKSWDTKHPTHGSHTYTETHPSQTNHGQKHNSWTTAQFNLWTQKHARARAGPS